MVYGRILGKTKLPAGLSYLVAAFSNRYKNNELVDSNHTDRVGTHYGLNLPEGTYRLLVLADQDQNGVLDETEVVGRRRITLSLESHPQMVMGNVDIVLSTKESAEWDINIPAPKISETRESLFFPKGTIRNLSDPLFDTDIAALGMYEPASFLETAPTMFYALEEESFKAPVIFVHGIGGSAREFATIVARLNRQLYKPWFFYYPSGGDLDQLAEVFYNIFLSGKAVPTSSTPMSIIAHSMGGLVAREALNKLQATKLENRVDLLSNNCNSIWRPS